ALRDEQARLAELRDTFAANQERLAALRAELGSQSGGLADLSDQFQQIAGQTQALLKDSLVSSQLPQRRDRLQRLLGIDGMPSVEAMRELWVMLQEEMTETGRTTQYSAAVAAPDGSQLQALVTRVGGFTAVSGDRFLRYLPEVGSLIEAEPQPALAHRAVAAAFTEARSGLQPMVIDPTRGSVLGLLAKVPSLKERLLQGRAIGFVIIALGVLGLGLALERFIVLQLEESRMRRQRVASTADQRNALGRVMLVYQEHRHLSPEALEMKLEEVVLNNTPGLQRGLGAIRLFAVITPMLGLLGTVTGLIETFHSITLFGAGDARLMAGGISQALVTTALGLSAAIPLMLLHSLLNAKCRRLITLLEEQSIGIIAEHAAPAGEARRAA
ncbi:MAG: MotA/TolQ/ExbB proton channel family protein, partial [Sedimenticolaceae bacterium]